MGLERCVNQPVMPRSASDLPAFGQVATEARARSFVVPSRESHGGDVAWGELPRGNDFTKDPPERQGAHPSKAQGSDRF
jgi:hypothetical protein